MVIRSVREVLKEIEITRKFLRNLQMILDTVRQMRGTSLVGYKTKVRSKSQTEIRYNLLIAEEWPK